MTGVRLGQENATRETLLLTQRLHPNRPKILILSGVSPFDTAALQVVRSFEPLLQERGATLEYLDHLSLDEVAQRLVTASDETSAVFAMYTQTPQDESCRGRDVLERFARSARIPIYGYLSSYLGYGIVGGVMGTLDDVARDAGHLTLRVLRGESPEFLPTQTVSLIPRFDGAQLRRWKVSPRQLPPGSVIRKEVAPAPGQPLASWQPPDDLEARYASLTTREREILTLVGEGWSNQRIAIKVGIALTTVKVHRGRAMHKLQAASVPELIRMLDYLAG
jgi:DNA-binding CsgD family transcriptional regulator